MAGASKGDLEAAKLGQRLNPSNIKEGTMESSLWCSRAFDYAKHAMERARIRRQLDNAPVAAADLDYIASRAGERRRRGQTVGQTAHVLGEHR